MWFEATRAEGAFLILLVQPLFQYPRKEVRSKHGITRGGCVNLFAIGASDIGKMPIFYSGLSLEYFSLAGARLSYSVRLKSTYVTISGNIVDTQGSPSGRNLGEEHLPGVSSRRFQRSRRARACGRALDPGHPRSPRRRCRGYLAVPACAAMTALPNEPALCTGCVPCHCFVDSGGCGSGSY